MIVTIMNTQNIIQAGIVTFTFQNLEIHLGNKEEGGNHPLTHALTQSLTHPHTHRTPCLRTAVQERFKKMGTPGDNRPENQEASNSAKNQLGTPPRSSGHLPAPGSLFLAFLPRGGGAR